MKIPKFILVMLLISSSLMDCKNSNPEPTKPKSPIMAYDLKELPEKTTIKLSDLGAIDIQYIPLETSEQSVISRIEKVIFSKNYFLTQLYTDIKMFRYDGSFVTKIGIVGRGPNEFTVAHCLDINPENETIYLIDGWQQRFLVYSNTGKFIRTFKYPLREAVDFRFTDDGILCYNKNNMGSTETSFVLIDTMGKIIQSYPNRYPWTRNFPTIAFQGENIFYKYGDHLIKKEIYCDTLYIYENKGFEPYLIINTGDRRITPKIRTESDFGLVIQNCLIQKNLFEFGDNIYYEFSVFHNGKSGGLSFIGSKDGNLHILFDPEKDLINDLDGGPNVWPKAMWDDSTIVSWIDAIKFKKFIASDEFKSSIPLYPEKKKELEILAKSLNDTDNPVLMLIKLE